MTENVYTLDLHSSVVSRLKSNDPTLTSIRFSYITGSHQLSELAKALRYNSHITELTFVSTLISNAGMMELAEALRINSSLELLRVAYNPAIEEVGWTALARTLANTASLRELQIVCNTTNLSMVLQLTCGLRVNSSLHTLQIFLMAHVMTSCEVQAIAVSLRENKNITSLALGRLTMTAVETVVEAIASNKTLLAVKLFSSISTGPVMNEKLEKYLQRNINLAKQTLHKALARVGSAPFDISDLIYEFVLE